MNYFLRLKKIFRDYAIFLIALAMLGLIISFSQSAFPRGLFGMGDVSISTGEKVAEEIIKAPEEIMTSECMTKSYFVSNSDANPDMDQKEDTLSPDKPDLVIGIGSDFHVSPELRNFNIIMGFAQAMSNLKPDFIIQAGDFIENRVKYDEKERTAGMADFRKADASLLGFEPRYHVIGSHEMFGFSKADFRELIGRESYYAFVQNDYQIIALDAMFEKNGQDVEFGNPQSGVYLGAIPEKEREWLKERLAASDKNIIFVHQPLYDMRNRNEIWKILSERKESILAIFSGHKHRARISNYGGILTVDLPSARYQKMYTVAELEGNNVKIKFHGL